MSEKDALKIRDQYKSSLIGRRFDNRAGWDIKDVIISPISKVATIYEDIWNNGISNEQALIRSKSTEEEYDVFIISHQWPWGSGNLLYERLSNYLKNNPI